MAEKKEKKAAAPKAEKAAKKPATRAPRAKKAEKAELVINAENAGFKAGDVYNTLAAAEAALSVKEIAKKAKISEEDAILGIGWLLKEGKLQGDGTKVSLA